MSDFEIVTTTAGAVSIRNIVVNEIMHNPVGPWREANDLYIKQSLFEERLLAPTEDDFVLEQNLINDFWHTSHSVFKHKPSRWMARKSGH